MHRYRCFALMFGLLLVAAAPPPFKTTTIASGLDHPWSIAFLPDGRALVTERAGRLRVLDHGKLLPAAIAGVPAVVVDGQAGLFEIALHPAFARNHMIYLSYIAGTAKAHSLRLARARFDGDRLSDVHEVWRQKPEFSSTANLGGRIAFLPDGTLVMSVGDAFEYKNDAQQLGNDYGKLIRLNDDGSVPADNPFSGRVGADPAIWSYGNRNAQGLAFDPVRRRLFEHEHGPQGGDEVNVIERGKNYGWPAATYGIDYDNSIISKFKTLPGMVDGIVVWVPSIAPSGLAVYRGAMFPEWQGDLLVGALKAQQLRVIDLDAAGRVRGQAVILEDFGARIRDVRVAPDGSVWLATDDEDGKLVRLSR